MELLKSGPEASDVRDALLAAVQRIRIPACD